MATRTTLGINFPAPVNYGPINVFSNVAKSAGAWRFNDSTLATVDALGNPTQDAFAYMFQSKPFTAGVYNIRFNSAVAVTVTDRFANGTISNYNFSAGVSTATWTITPSGDNGGNIALVITGSTATGGIQNLSVILQSDAALGAGVASAGSPQGQCISQSCASLFNAGNPVRFLDFTGVNVSTEVNWSDRLLPTVTNCASIGKQARGSWEEVVNFCNTMNVNPWINIPNQASDAYITNLANLFKYGSDGTNPYTSVQASPVWAPLNSNLQIQVEDANEVWNSLTVPFHFNLQNVATANIAVTAVASAFSEGETIYQGASLGAATWKATLNTTSTALGNATNITSGTGYFWVSNESGTYAPATQIVGNNSPGTQTATGGTRTANANAIAGFLNTNFPTDSFGNGYRWNCIQTLRISELFRAVYPNDMPENTAKIKPMLMAQLSYDTGPMASMMSIFPIISNAAGGGLTIPGLTVRNPNYYLYGLGCSYYYSPTYAGAGVTAANAVANGTSITLTYNTPLSSPIAVGKTITTSGFTFTGFTNGNYVLTASTTTSCTFASTVTAGASSSAGSIQFQPTTIDDIFGNSTTWDTAGFAISLSGHARWAASIGVKFCAYEGYLSWNNAVGVGGQAAIEIAAFYDSRTIVKILAYENIWDSVGGDIHCAYSMGNVGTDWNIVIDKTVPANSKYTAWLAAQAAPQANPTYWPQVGYVVPGGLYAARLDTTYAVPGATNGPFAAGVGAYPVYVFATPQYRRASTFTANITASTATTMDTYINGVLISAGQPITVGTNNYGHGALLQNTLQSVSYYFHGACTLNSVQMT